MNYKFNANIRPTETYYIPNQWKFNEDFGELYRLKIASLIEADNSVSWSALFIIHHAKTGCAYKLVSERFWSGLWLWIP